MVVHRITGIRRRRLFLIQACALLLVFGLSATAHGGGKVGFGCSPGFDVGAVSFEESLELPRIQAGLAAGVYTIDDLAAGFQKVDHNGNGLICLKDVGALNDGADSWDFFYVSADDNASVPGG